jgi:hypothetical protein
MRTPIIVKSGSLEIHSDVEFGSPVLEGEYFHHALSTDLARGVLVDLVARHGGTLTPFVDGSPGRRELRIYVAGETDAFVLYRLERILFLEIEERLSVLRHPLPAPAPNAGRKLRYNVPGNPQVRRVELNRWDAAGVPLEPFKTDCQDLVSFISVVPTFRKSRIGWEWLAGGAALGAGAVLLTKILRHRRLDR